ncbi:hypothetical protein EC912_102416 [Luteibacter rhizovicinus]|uniref:Uncharacterized protein n=1 Tax=Luteibacter rhizovicinus TaxID=242606 RepID=A0A4R3YT24_9GAMM|nr:hypothetical protein [Luteibacter rhizovicinus]TCV96067.1 hypothetical protein EC912_102416 [Luteibacter rhizovicinus]
MRSLLFRIIGVFEIAGGLFGLVALLHRVLGAGGLNAIVAVLGLLAFAFVLVAGVLLIAGDALGERLSIWAQFLQTPLLATPLVSYAFSSGAFANLFLTLQSSPRLGFDWSIATHGWLLAFGGPSVSHIGVNLLALVSWLILRFSR